MSELKEQNGSSAAAATAPAEQPNPAFVQANGEPAGKDSDTKPRSSSFKDSDKYVRTGSGTFVRQVRTSVACHQDDVKLAVVAA